MIATRGNRTFQRIAPNDAINPKRIYDKPSMTRVGRASNRDNSLLRCMSPLMALRWGNRPASLWIVEDFGCCASG
jgi:hypothetical protein